MVPTTTAAFLLALVDADHELRPNSNWTAVFPPHATSALESSYTGTEAAMKPPTPDATASESDALADAPKNLYFLATAYSRYCASALVGHGGPYVVPPAHSVRS